MNKYYKYTSKSIFQEVAFQGTSPAVTTVTTELAPQGSAACIRAFSCFSAPCNYLNVSLDAADTSKLVSASFNKKDSSSTSLLDFYVPLHQLQGVLGGLGGSSGLGSYFNIPGPGIFSDDGLEVVINIPPNTGNSLNATAGPIMAVLNVVYSK